jgi:hypothetical protein
VHLAPRHHTAVRPDHQHPAVGSGAGTGQFSH